MASRRLDDRRHQVQQWIVGLIVVWLITQSAAIAVYCAGLGIIDRSNFQSAWGKSLMLLFAVAACPTAAASGASFVTTLWHHRILPAGWIVAGVVPWLIVITEAAGLLLSWVS